MGQSRYALLFLTFFIANLCWAGQGVNSETGRLDLCLTIEETDASPSNTSCGTVSVTNGALTDDGDGTYTLDVTAVSAATSRHI